MSEIIRYSVSELRPGDVIEFNNATFKTELPLFEDMVAEDIARLHTEVEAYEWSHREKLHEIMRPQGNNGTILNVRLIVMGDAYERLTQINNHGLKLLKSVKMKHILDVAESRKDEYRGFTFTADIKRSGKVIEQMYREVYFLPSDWGKNNERPLQEHNPHVRRIFAVPEVEMPIIDFSNMPRQIGFAALKNS